jgi:hypothetical protein
VIGSTLLTQPNQPFNLHFVLPGPFEGTQMLEIEIDLNRTFQVPGDPRTFGLVFGTFALE